MLIYAGILLLLGVIGLGVFWKYMESYEQSRPQTAVDAYIAQLDEDAIRQKCQSFLDSLDSCVQSREDAFSCIQDSLSGGIISIRTGKLDVEGNPVYLLKTGNQTIGSLSVTQGEEGRFGFRNWQVTGESLDFSHLIGEPFSLTIPGDFTVSLNGNVLDDRYVLEAEISYPALADFAGQFDMVHLVRYGADNFLGEPSVQVLDRDGNVVEIREETDLNRFIPVCDDSEGEQLYAALETFLNRYVAFTGSANREIQGNYARLQSCLVKNGALAQRLRKAFDGLQYAQSYSDTIREIMVHQYYRVSPQRYMCDVTYVVDTVGRHGLITSENNMKVVFLETADGLKVEALSSY